MQQQKKKNSDLKTKMLCASIQHELLLLEFQQIWRTICQATVVFFPPLFAFGAEKKNSMIHTHHNDLTSRQCSDVPQPNDENKN